MSSYLRKAAKSKCLQVDVEGCELEVLQGVQSQDWCHIDQV